MNLTGLRLKDDPEFVLKTFYFDLPEKYYISDGNFVFEIMNEMKRTFSFSVNQFHLYIMEIDRVLRKKDHLFQIQNTEDFFNEFSFLNIYPEITLGVEVENRLIELAYRLYCSVLSIMMTNKLYLPQPVLQVDERYKVNCYHIGGYDNFSIILYKTNPWSPI